MPKRGQTKSHFGEKCNLIRGCRKNSVRGKRQGGEEKRSQGSINLNKVNSIPQNKIQKRGEVGGRRNYVVGIHLSHPYRTKAGTFGAVDYFLRTKEETKKKSSLGQIAHSDSERRQQHYKNEREEKRIISFEGSQN